MHAVPQPLVMSTSTAAANLQVQKTLTADAAAQWCIGYVGITFSGAVPAAVTTVVISDGATSITMPVPVAGVVYALDMPLGFAKGAAVTITTPAGIGASVVTAVDVGAFANRLP